MKRFAWLGATLMIVGCGPEWAGRYEGRLTGTVFICEDGTTFGWEVAGPDVLEITRNQDRLSITSEVFSWCGPIQAQADDYRLTLIETQCQRPAGATFTAWFTEGFMTFVNDVEVQPDFDLEVLWDDMPGQRCTMQVGGIFTKTE